MVTVAAGLVGLGYAVYSHRIESTLLDSAWKIGSIFQPTLFIVVAGALFFRRATPAGGIACLLMGIGYTSLAASGGLAYIGTETGIENNPLLSKFFAWDHGSAPVRALVGMPLSAAVLLSLIHI